MRCVICKQSKTRPGYSIVTLERDDLTLVIKRVPAQVCPNCVEEYVDETVAGNFLETAEKLADAGAQVDIREYASA